MLSASSPQPRVSIVVPVYDEEGAAPGLAREIAAAFTGEAFEIVFVDDASRDATRARLMALTPEIPELRVMAHGRNAGQSRAIRTGVLAARAPLIVMLDGDGQNDPADAPRLLAALEAGPRRTGDDRGRAGQSPRQRVEALGVALGQRPAAPAARRRGGRHRVRPQGVQARGLSAPALFRSPAPLSAGTDDPRGLPDRLRAGRPSGARERAVEIHQSAAAGGGGVRPAGRDVAAGAARNPGGVVEC